MRMGHRQPPHLGGPVFHAFILTHFRRLRREIEIRSVASKCQSMPANVPLTSCLQASSVDLLVENGDEGPSPEPPPRRISVPSFAEEPASPRRAMSTGSFNVVEEIYTCEEFHGTIDRVETETLLSTYGRSGSWLLRESARAKGTFVLSINWLGRVLRCGRAHPDTYFAGTSHARFLHNCVTNFSTEHPRLARRC